MVSFLVGSFLMLSGGTRSVATNSENVKPAVVVAETIPLNLEPLTNSINAIIAEYPGMDIGVSLVDIKTGEAQSYGVQVPFVAASTAKLLTAIAYLHDVEQGKLSLDQQIGGQTAKKALEALIINSDNQAWYDLNNIVMTHAELLEYANIIGFTGYDPDSNTVIPSSLANLLSNLYQKRLLNEVNTNLLLSFMKRAKEVEYITSIIPSGVSVYHKPGYLNDRIHDALIIDGNNRPYVLVIFTKSRSANYDVQAGTDVFVRTAKATFATFLE